MKKLRVLREARGWSRAKLARAADMNAVTVGQIELRRFVPYPRQLAQLADALGVAIDEAATLVEEIVGDAVIEREASR
jgi:transcriptional regulator with XRE-family HTH domain